MILYQFGIVGIYIQYTVIGENRAGGFASKLWLFTNYSYYIYIWYYNIEYSVNTLWTKKKKFGDNNAWPVL